MQDFRTKVYPGGTPPTPPPPRRRRSRAWCASLLLLAGLAASAQEVTPEVQQLYERAHTEAAVNPSAAIADYRKLLQLSPGLAPAWNNLGRLLFSQGRLPEAVDALSSGLALNPSMAPAQIMLGASYLELGNPQKALDPLQAGVQAMPDDRFARLTLARTLIALDRPTEALTELNRLTTADPRDQEAWYLAGKLYLQLSQAALARVQTIDPNSALAHILEGEVMDSLSNTPGAVAAYKQAIAAAPNDPAPLQHLADLYWHTGDWAHARDTYATLLKLQPSNCSAHWKLANSLDELGEPPVTALPDLNLALTECPSLAQARAERARLLLRSGKPADALPDLLQAEKQAPDEPTVQQLLAQTYRALGDRTRADAANQRFLALQQSIHQAQERHAAAVVQANQ